MGEEEWEELGRKLRRLIHDAKWIYDSLLNAQRAVVERDIVSAVDELESAHTHAEELPYDMSEALNQAYRIQ